MNRKEGWTEICYEIDAKDLLVAFDEQWIDSARLNHAAYLGEPSILQRSLWEFISDRETRLIYEMLFRKVREVSKKVAFFYRCDTPTQRRLMQMELQRGQQDHIQLVSRVSHLEQRKYVALLDPTIPRSESSRVICSWCKRVELPTKQWAEVEVAINKLGLFETTLLPQLIHGVCPDCLSTFRGWRNDTVVH